MAVSYAADPRVVNVFLYDGAIVPDPEGIITGGHANATPRTVAVRRASRSLGRR